MKRALPYLIGVVVGLAVVIALLTRGGPESGVESTWSREASRPAARGTRDDRERRPATDLVERLREGGPSIEELAARPLPASLRGTEVGGDLAADENGHLIVAPGVLELFDYFLSASGEEPLEVIKARIIAEIRQRLPPTAQREAIELLEDYLSYRERAKHMWADGEIAEDLGARLEQLRVLRREAFGEEHANALFGEQEAIDFVAIAQREVAQDPDLTAEEKRARIEELEQQLPEPVREARAEAMKPVRYLREYETMVREGASPEEIREMRVEYFGEEAANRLEALDHEQAVWRERMQDYRAQRRAIENDARLSDARRREAIEALRADLFDEKERIRVEALDRLEARGQLP